MAHNHSRNKLRPEDFNGGKAVLVASSGGHLAQLARISRKWVLSEDSLWVTFDTEQSRELLAGKRVLFVPYVPPRGARQALAAAKLVRSHIAGEDFDFCVSTGAALAVFILARAGIHALPTFYIESVSRLNGPSLTGRILRFLPGVTKFSQHEGWARGRWHSYPSVLEDFEVAERGQELPERPKIFVTLGTIHPYRFDSLVHSVMAAGIADDRTIWQLGVTEIDGLPGNVNKFMGPNSFYRAAKSADLVISHAGVGTVLGLMELGIHPIVVPRRKSRGEHVDDHQIQIAELIRKSGVATVVDATEICEQTLRDAYRFVNLAPTNAAVN